MKKVWFLFFLALTLTACSKETSQETNNLEEDEADSVEYKKISAEEAKEMMVDGNIVLDVRTEKEYNETHIEGALLLPLDDILEDNLEAISDQNQIILIYCRSGNRSKTAAKELIKKGYTKVYDFGGIKDWPYETVKK